MQRMDMDRTQDFRQIIDAVDTPVFVIKVEEDGRFTYLEVNEAVAHATGLRRENFLGRTPDELPALSGVQTIAFRANYERCLEAGETVRYRERLVVNGEDGWWLTRLTPVRDETGRISRIIGSSINATDRRRIESRFRLIAETIDDVFWIGTPGLDQLLYVNPAYEQVFGRSCESLYANPHSFLEAVHPDDREAIRTRVAAFPLAQWESEYRIVWPDGTVRWIRDRGFPVPEREVGAGLTARVSTDITRQKQAERALAESEEKFRRISQSAVDAILMIDDRGRLTYWNPAAQRIFGYAEHEVLGRNLHRMLAPERYRQAHREAFAAFTAHGTGAAIGKTLELEALRKDGTEFPMELSVSSLQVDGRWHAVGMLRDITGRKRAEETLRRTNRALRTLSACNEALVRARDEDGLRREICRTLVETGGYRLAWIGEAETGGEQRIVPVASAGTDRDRGYLDGIAIHWGEGLLGAGPSGTAIRSGRTQVVRDTAIDPGFAPWRDKALEHGFHASLSVPLRDNGRAYGVLNVYAADAEAFDTQEIGLLEELAGDITFGLRSLRIARERDAANAALQKVLLQTIEAVALTVEKRDPYTAGHQQRVAALAVAIAEEMGLDGQRIEGIRIGGLIHDIGKITVPAEYLARPGALSEAEFLVIRAHPEVGYEIMKGVESPWPLSLMILQHHERLDGSGYPQGLEGDGILLEARILAVADVVEAMASHRPYRPALGLEPALDEIQAGRGTRFDARVVDACLRLFRERDYRLD